MKTNARKYFWNTNYFSKINTKDKAYWLGFIYADGCNQPKYNKLSMLLAIKDIEHLRKFSLYLKIDPNQIYIMPAPSSAFIKGRQINATPSCRLSLNSKILSQDLLKLGVFPRKAFTLKFPKISSIPQKLMSHFVRGFFDGDGCITFSKNNHATRYRIVIVSSPIFCKQLSKFIKKTLNINTGIWHREKLSLVCISGNRQVKIFCDWIYKGTTKNIYLDRKYEIYKKLKKLIKKINKRYLNTYSKYTNITYDKKREKWMACARINKKTVHIGRFLNEEVAFKAQKKFYKTQEITKPDPKLP